MPERILIEAADCLKCIAHPMRLRIIELLLDREYTVGQIARICSMTQPATSEHLRLMSNKGFLKKERRQRNMYYKVSEDQLNGGEFAPLTGDDWSLIKVMLDENEALFGVPVERLLTFEGKTLAPEQMYRKIQPKAVRALQAEEAWVAEEH